MQPFKFKYTPGLLKRKQVMKLASEAYTARLTIKDSEAFIAKTFSDGRYNAAQIHIMAQRLHKAKTWGAVQSIAWKIAKQLLDNAVAYVEAIMNDPHFNDLNRKVYTHRVRNGKTPMGVDSHLEETVYTAAYGRVVVFPLLSKALAQ